ncbi:sugar/nucleoside kinase (ribokinase family) [Rhizobium sp. BK529]|uniref:PfkB family carbohydrate kinase n=1 Tax=unclassified Rhizobium TaxID=2613769 RepID=UPI001049F7DD|nr:MULTISPECIES: PfkB family carbohydrate kinase [unclassified Rhizobium]MBB3593374.1 sugar/nucleoside kinase (ribokinase family) [Rhizobium sp. BK529]TCS03171.1 sugar/nucleoside kinase (ribokinase family) [Rhizobium sp. BK418]
MTSPTADCRPRHVLCVGAAVLDTLFRVKAIPQVPGKVLPYDMLQVAEGMASSAAFAIIRLGGMASLWGAVGDDQAGEQILTELQRAGIDVSGSARVAGARSAVSTILIDDDGERLIVPFYDPRLHENVREVTADDLTAFDSVMVDVRWPALALKVLRTARTAGKPAILDGDVAPPHIIDMLAKEADHIIFSEPAAHSLSQISDPAGMVSFLKRQYRQALVVVTAGERGSYWWDEEMGTVAHMPAFRIKTIDTLAAGDIFHGAYALAISEGLATDAAIRMASAAAALKCSVFGGRLGAPDRIAVSALLDEAACR